ncbi:MAG: hypothetical protein PPP56_06030, partial [Longimonas sp.]|uniref:hypothetical protein n=1 Tax=Longimonas sp. TaxID=2039626 RepID=UPI00334D041E
TALAWWYSADGSTWDAPPAIHVDDVSWAALPIVMEDETVKSPAAISSAGHTGTSGADQMVFFVYLICPVELSMYKYSEYDMLFAQ